jgi:hypothetical protein
MMRISCCSQQWFIDIGRFVDRTDANLGRGAKQRTPSLVDGGCKVQNERRAAIWNKKGDQENGRQNECVGVSDGKRKKVEE